MAPRENAAAGARSRDLEVICCLVVVVGFDLLFLQRIQKERVSGCMDNKGDCKGGSEGGVFTSSVIWGGAGVVLVEVDGMPAGSVPKSVISC